MAGTFVQSDPDESQDGSPAPVLTGVAAGNCLICALSYGNSNTITSVVSSNGSTALTEGPTTETDAWNRVSIWYLENANSGTHTVTVTLNSTGHYCRAVLLEYSGLETSSVLEASNGNGTASGTSIGSNNVVSAQDCLYIGNGTQAGATAGLSHSLTGGSERVEDTDATFMPYSVVESPTLNGTYANTFSKAGGAEAMGTVLAAFREAAAGAASTHHLHLPLLGVG